jgi:hypothetical protein
LSKSESDIKREEGKGEFQFFIDKGEQLKARLDELKPDKENSSQEINRFFLGGEQNKGNSNRK